MEHWECLTGSNHEGWRALKREHIRQVQQRERFQVPISFMLLAWDELGSLLIPRLADIELQVSAAALYCLPESGLTWGFAKVQLGEGCHAVPPSSTAHILPHWRLMGTLRYNAQAVPCPQLLCGRFTTCSTDATSLMSLFAES